MKIILTVVDQSRVVKELLDAMDRSCDLPHESRLVRIDDFIVPPKRKIESDDSIPYSCEVEIVHPSKTAMEITLLQTPRHSIDTDRLEYAAVLYWNGAGSEKDKCRGAYFYFLQYMRSRERQDFIRLDCREKVTQRHRLYGPDLFAADNFSLPWMLSIASKEIKLEDQRILPPKKYGEPEELARELVKGFRSFRSGLGEIIDLSRKASNNPTTKRIIGRERAKSKLIYAWACATMPSFAGQASLIRKGAGYYIEKLFSELETKSA